jgi:hypothetical protein
MPTKLKPKGLSRFDFLWAWPQDSARLSPFEHLGLFAVFAFCALSTTRAQADTIYRCGEAYSTSNQCGNVAATEVKPSSVLHTTGQDKNNLATQDLREAQALEKQRLQAERQAAQSAPMRLSTPSPVPTSVASNEPPTNTPKRYGKHTRKTNSPYFTAVDPKAASQKKSTAKAVPATPTSSP